LQEIPCHLRSRRRRASGTVMPAYFDRQV
jgi:hypothetical protein